MLIIISELGFTYNKLINSIFSAKPDVTFIVNDEDITELISGNLNPQKAFFQGKIKIQGNMAMALKLSELPKVAEKRINELRSKL